MNQTSDIDANKRPVNSWWLASLGSVLVWARLRVLPSGTAEVFDCDGHTVTYDSDDSARAALLDADYFALDGLDEDDAARLGVSLDVLTPPSAKSDADLGSRMIQPLARED
ncbi:MAG: hypothetical protein ABIQ97_01805 [Lysobacteraceae bacterium]